MNWTKENLKNKNATINMKCKDEESFKWSVTRALNPSIKSPERITKILIRQSMNYNWEGLDFPTPLEQIETFERNNNLLINVFGLNEGRIQRLRVPKGVHAGRISLMLIDDRYTVVKSVSRLLYGQTTKSHCKRFYCNNCLKGLPSEGRLNKHVTLECVYSDARRSAIQTDQTPVESQRLCDLCRMHGRSLCSLHMGVEDMLKDAWLVRTVMSVKRSAADPRRMYPISSSVNGERYTVAFKGGRWVFSYVGKESVAM